MISVKNSQPTGLTLAVKSVTIARTGGADKVAFELDVPSPYLDGSMVTAQASVPAGTAEQWLASLGVPESSWEVLVK